MLRLSPADAHICHSLPCRVYVSIFGYHNSSYSLVATQERAARTRVSDGVPLQGELESKEWAYYRFTINDAAVDGFDVSVDPQFGDPDVYVSCGAAHRSCPPTERPPGCSTLSGGLAGPGGDAASDTALLTALARPHLAGHCRMVGALAICLHVDRHPQQG